MILTAHQPLYLPWLGFFDKLAKADKFVYFDDVQYQDKDFNNRNRIKTKDGSLLLSIPIKSKNHFNLKLKDAEIDNSQPWQRKHLKSIKLAYQKAPYFEKYFPHLELFLQTKWWRLSDLNFEMLSYFLIQLRIPIPISRMSLYEPSFEGQKSGLVLDMCKKMGANTYIFGAMGKDYADVEAFNKAGIKVEFQDYKHPVYKQLHGPFVSHMSIIDLLFNEGPNSLKILTNKN